MVELITDRMQYHVTLLNRLRKKAWSKMSSSEQASWNGEATKGAYNYTDLNRVETAVSELSSELGLTLTTKTNWTLWDIPTRSEMERYLENVVAIRDACPGDVQFPTLPSSMSGLTYIGANNIEKVLLMVYEELQGGSVNPDPDPDPNPDPDPDPDIPDTPGGEDTEHKCVLGEFILGECTIGNDPVGSESADFIRSGEVYCGEVL